MVIFIWGEAERNKSLGGEGVSFQDFDGKGVDVVVVVRVELWGEAGEHAHEGGSSGVMVAGGFGIFIYERGDWRVF